MVRIEKRGKGKGAEHEIAAKMAEEKREGKDRDWLRSSFIPVAGGQGQIQKGIVSLCKGKCVVWPLFIVVFLAEQQQQHIVEQNRVQEVPIFLFPFSFFGGVRLVLPFVVWRGSPPLLPWHGTHHPLQNLILPQKHPLPSAFFFPTTTFL